MLPDENWVKIQTAFGGICGSDLNVIFLHDSPSMSPFCSFPFIFGHEAVGEIQEVGGNVEGFNAGDRVLVNPLLCCEQRNIDPRCPSCQREDLARCENFAEGSLSPASILGFCRDTGGSWGEYFVAHKSRLYKLPDNLTYEDAIFTDPLASALHPIMRNMPTDDENVLIIGAGIIGLFAVAGLRALGSKCGISVLAKYGFQAELAKKFGANNVLSYENDYYENLRKIVGGKLYKPILGERVMVGGFDKTFDCVASDSTLNTAMNFTDRGGTLVVVELATVPQKVDWSPAWFKELQIKGSFCYSVEEFEGNTTNSFIKAFELIQKCSFSFKTILERPWSHALVNSAICR